MKKAFYHSLLISWIILILASNGSAQIQTGALRGTINDEQGNPLPGVTVTVTSPSLQGKNIYISEEGGNFRFPALPPGTYAVKAELTGFKNIERPGIIINVGKTTTISLEMSISAVEEEITVTAPAPIVDVSSSNLSVTVTPDLIKAIPMRRDILDVYRSAPGTVGEDQAQDYRKSSSVYGGAVHESKISMDGVDLVDPQRGYISADVTFEAIDEVEMALGGHQAEVGGVAAGYINVVSKSGGNQLSGGLTLSGTTDSFLENVVPQEQLTSTGLASPIYFKYQFDSGLSLGGPIIKDKLWFFVSGKYGDRNQKTMFIPFTDPYGVYHRAFDYRRQEYAVLSKLTMQITSKLRWVGMYQFTMFDDNPSAWAASRPYQPWELAHQWEDGSHTISQNVLYTLNQDTLVEARMGYVDRYLNCFMHDSEGPSYRIGAQDMATGYLWGSVEVFGEEIYRRKMLNLGINLTRFQDDFLGMDHQFKGGIEYSGATTASQRTRPQPYNLYWWNGEPWRYHSTTPYMGSFYINTPQRNRDEMPYNNGFWRISGFLQDSINIKGRLTLNLGIRYDEAHGYLPESYLKGWYDNFFGGLANILVPDLFPTADLTVPAMDDIIVYKKLSPRLGLSYDLFGNQKTSLKASFSRYAESLLGWNLEMFNPFGNRTVTITWYDNNRNAYFDHPPVDRYVVGSYSRFITDTETLRNQVDPSLSCPYTDEWIAGIGHELAANFSITLSFIYKEAKNLVAQNNLVNPRDSNEWIPYTVKDPGGDGNFGTGDDQDLTVYMLKREAQPDLYQKQNMTDASRKYWGIDLVLFKRMANNWQFSGSITYSKTWGNYSHAYGSITGTSNWWNPNEFLFRTGRLTFDRPLIIKAMATIILPYQINVSPYVRHFSGEPWGRTVTIYFPSQVKGFLPKSPTVTVRTESVGARRRLPETYFDLRVEKEFNAGPGRLGLYFEIFNLFGRYMFSFNDNPGGYIYADGSFARFPTYGRATSVQGSRFINFAARYKF